MKNADMPAMPTVMFTGLTKREMFAMHAMVAVAQTEMLATCRPEQIDALIKLLAEQATRLADEVLLELELSK